MFVAYWEGKQIQNQPRISSLIKFQNIGSGKSKPRDQGVIALMMHGLLDFQRKKAQIISFGSNQQFDNCFFVFVAYWEGKHF